MDLIELREGARRHPWELSRARAVERIVHRHGGPARTILDWGCGDAFTGRTLFERFAAEQLVGIDPYLSDAQRSDLAGGDPRVRLLRDASELTSERFELALLCDVIEHVEDDAGLVTRVADGFLVPGGRLLVTVPAFQSLFSQHDVELKHFRRYRLGELEAVLDRAGLEISGSGYLFGTLLPARAASKLWSLARPEPAPRRSIGIGGWNGGRLASGLAETVLQADNSLLLFLSERGLKLPGLTAWAACRKTG